MTTEEQWWGTDLLYGGPPDRMWAFVGEPISLSHLRAGVREAAAALRDAGVGPMDSVALYLPPGPTLIEHLLAVWTLNAQAVLIDIRLAQPEAQELLALIKPGFLLRHDPGTPVPVGIVRRTTVDCVPLPGGMAALPDTVLVQFTSGSTGTPKAIARSATSLRDELARYAQLPGMPTAGDRILLLNSLIHTMGLVGGILHGLASGAELILPQGLGGGAGGLLRLAATEHATAIFGVPLHYDLLSRAQAVPGLAPRLALSAGEMLPKEVYERFGERFGISVSPVYGTTETGIICAQLTHPCPPPGVGPPAGGLAVRVSDGEVLVGLDRDPYLHGDGERYRDGWLRTHDRAEADPATGAIRLLGRSDSLASVGGLKVDLTYVERVLLDCEGVQEAVVVLDGVITAYVVTEHGVTTRQLVDHCRHRLADFKVPRRFRITPALPRNVGGKVLRDPEAIRRALAVLAI